MSALSLTSLDNSHVSPCLCSAGVPLSSHDHNARQWKGESGARALVARAWKGCLKRMTDRYWSHCTVLNRTVTDNSSEFASFGCQSFFHVLGPGVKDSNAERTCTLDMDTAINFIPIDEIKAGLRRPPDPDRLPKD